MSTSKCEIISTFKLRAKKPLDLETPFSQIAPSDLEGARFIGSKSETAIDPFEKAKKSAFLANIRDLIDNLNSKLLNPKEKVILGARLPIKGNTVPRVVVAEVLGLSEPRVLQIENSALNKVRKHAQTRNYAPNYTPETSNKPGDEIRPFLNGVVNACHQNDLPRALHNLAEAKVALMRGIAKSESGQLIKVLEDPLFETFTPETIKLKLWPHYSKSQIKEVIEFNKRDDPLAKEVQSLDSVTRKRFAVELRQLQPQTTQVKVVVEDTQPQMTQQSETLPEKPKTPRPPTFLERLKGVIDRFIG